MIEQCSIEGDICKTFDSLKAMGLRLGIISNTFINGCSLDRHLDEFGLLEYFPIRVYSCALGFRKPNVKIFEYAAQQIGLESHEIAYVGDRIDFDVEGSAKAGMFPILKRAYSSHGKRIPNGTAVIEKLSELPELLMRKE